MKRKFPVTILVLAVVVAILWFAPGGIRDNSANTPTNMATPTASAEPDISLAECYYGLVGQDQLLMKIDLIESENIRAKINYQFLNKDSSWGFLIGKVSANKITGTFTYFAEGALSTRELTYTKSGENYIGDGFTLKPSNECVLANFGTERIFRSVAISNIRTTNFQDPETGLYVKSEFNIVGVKAKQSYRCFINAMDTDGATLQYWAIEGNTFDPRPGTSYSAQTNLTEDQLPRLFNSSVQCSLADITR